MAMRAALLLAWIGLCGSCGDDDAAGGVDAGPIVDGGTSLLGSPCGYDPATGNMTQNCQPPFEPNDCVDSASFPDPGQGYCSPACGTTAYPSADAKPGTCGTTPPAGGDAVCQAAAPAGWTGKCELCGDTGSVLEWVCTIRCQTAEPQCPGGLAPLNIGVCICVR